MENRKLSNFRETLEYHYAVLMEKKGLFLSELVTTEGLLEDISFYYMQQDRYGNMVSFSKHKLRNSCGMFFTKNIFESQNRMIYIPTADDFEILEEFATLDEFFKFFQVKVTLDKQISFADEKRELEDEDEEEE